MFIRSDNLPEMTLFCKKRGILITFYRFSNLGNIRNFLRNSTYFVRFRQKSRKFTKKFASVVTFFCSKNQKKMLKLLADFLLKVLDLSGAKGCKS